MKAETQYNDYTGIVAADISDHIDLNEFISEQGINIDNYEAIGARLFSSSFGGHSISVFCIDRNKSESNTKHIVQIDFDDKLSIEAFLSIFKRFEVILYSENILDIKETLTIN